MPVGSGPQGVYFDLEEVRRVVTAINGAFIDAGGPPVQFYIGFSDKSSDSIAVYATDGTTHALWCSDEQVFDGATSLTMYPVQPAMFGIGVFDKEAFLKVEGKSCRLSVDSTISSKFQNRVCVESTFDEPKELKLPSGISPCYTYYGMQYANPADVMALLTGMGMLYGFGDAPGLILHKDRLEGITIGERPGKFEIYGSTDCEVEMPMFFTLTRTFCYVTLNMMLASGVMDTGRSMYIGVFDDSPIGGGNVVYLKRGKCAVFCSTEEQAAPKWVDYMPLAFVDQVRINQPSAFLMFSALASMACTEGVDQVEFSYKPSAGFGGWIPKGEGAMEARCDSDLGSMPAFDITLSRFQVVALSNTLGAAGEDAVVELILGEDDELIASVGSNENWMIRLK